jgi:hypothetical protein
MQKSFLAAVVFFVAAQIAVSQNWTLTSAGTNDWLCVASSANGNTLIAGQYLGGIEVSTNAGATWATNEMLTNAYWTSVASSADGTKLLAAAAYEGGDTVNGLFLSTNSGATWVSNSLPVMYWGSVAMSADGKIMAAAAPLNSGLELFGGSVFCSTNSGSAWSSNGLENACGAAMSADGQKIFVTGLLQPCFSTNFGTSWTEMTNAPSSYDFLSPSQYIASSADGSRLILAVTGSDAAPYLIYTSADSGNTWTLAQVPGKAWNFVTSSANGKTLMVSGFGQFEPSSLYISTNSGASWTSNSVPNENWAETACSADGGKLVAAPASGPIYISQSLQRPLINATPKDYQLQLSWLIPSTNFVLEQSADLYNWAAVTNSPELNLANLNEQILISPTNGTGFYRLVH